MPSATDFLPSSMTEFMNFDRTRSPNLGSGRISRFSGRRRRDIGCFLSLQPVPEPVRGLLLPSVSTRHAELVSASIHQPAARVEKWIPACAGMTLRWLTPARSLGSLGAVLGA